MDLQEFRKLIEESDNRISTIRENSSELNFSMSELISVVNELFSDEDKIAFLSTFKKVSSNHRLSVMKSIGSDEVKIGAMKDEELTEGFSNYNIKNIVESLHDEGKLSIFHDSEFTKSKQISIIDIVNMVKGMSDESKMRFLDDEELKQLYEFNSVNYQEIITSMDQASIEEILSNKDKAISYFGEYYATNIVTIIKALEDKSKQLGFIDNYDLLPSNITDIIKEHDDESKRDILLSRKYDFRESDIDTVLTTFDVPNLLDFIQNNQDYLKENNAYIHNIVMHLSKEKQLEFIASIDKIDISLGDKLKSFVVLKEETKAEIDRTGLAEKYLQVMDLPFNTDPFKDNYANLVVDLTRDLSIYKNLDELIHITPQDFPFEEHGKLVELAKVCPNIRVNDKIGLDISTGQEFVNGEEWIQDVLSNMKEDWSDIQKAAYIDYRIGKKISYTPDFDTEVSDDASARALWKIIDSGYGVCNGIAQVEQYLLKHVGIESELVSSGRHSFLKVKNLEIPREDGTTVVGDTVFDPTWNLTSHRYDAYPNHFARSYEEIRKFDILTDGTDKECHKNDEAFSGETIEIEENVLREIYKSIGLTKENGHFPISDMMDKSDEIAASELSAEDKIAKQLELLSTTHPEFASCQNSTISILSGNILNHPEMKFEKLVVNRVYNRNDKDKTPSVYVYYKDGEETEGFFVAEPGSKSFSQMSKESFIETYECYEQDMKLTEGLRPWEKGAKEVEQDLTRSSGTARRYRTKGRG